MAWPSPDPNVGPFADDDTAAVLADALEELGRRRTLHWLGDSAVTLQLLVSLQQQITARLPDAVADARDQDYSWAEIGTCLGITRAAAWNRYARPGRRGTPQPLDPD